MRFPLLFALLGTVACSDATTVAPNVPPDPPQPPVIAIPKIIAQYALILVNGSPPPSKSPVGAGDWDYDGATFELVSAGLILNQDGTFVESWVHRRTHQGSSSFIKAEHIGRYIKISESTLRIGDGGATSFATLTATRLVWQFAGFTLTYELTK